MKDDTLAELERGAQKLLAAARRAHLREGEAQPAARDVMRVAVMALAAEISERDDTAAFKGICRAITAVSIQHGQSCERITQAMAAALAEAWADHEAEAALRDARAAGA